MGTRETGSLVTDREEHVEHQHTAAAPQRGEAHDRPTRVRYQMLGLILIATVINYIDRINISVVAPFMSKDLGLDKLSMGLIFSAFAWTYAFALIPGGYIADRFGSRIGYGASLISWSVATAFQGLAGGFASLFGLRLAVGLMELPAFPANARAVTMWFPMQERGLATSVYVMGQYIGTALFSGALLWVASEFGWRWVFYITGGVGIAFGIVWFFLYRDPSECRRVSPAELSYIQDNGGLVSNKESKAFTFASILNLLRYRQIVALCIGKYCSSSALYFFLTWFPTYLVEERKMTMIKVGFFAAMPYIGATAGILLAGAISDWLIRRGVSMSAARKAPLVVGSLMGTSILLANVVQSDAAAIAILTCAFFAQGVSATSWAAVSEIAPRQYIGLTSGITSLSANLAGIVTPIVIGYIVHITGSFAWAINFVGLMAVIGALSYSLLLGRIHRIVVEELVAIPPGRPAHA